MSATSRLLWANLRAHLRRYVATGVAITISLVFVSLALNFAQGIKVSINSQLTAQIQGSSVVVSEGESFVDLSPVPSALRDRRGVADVVPVVSAAVKVRNDGNERVETLEARLPEPFMQVSVFDGRLPSASDEVALPENLAAVLELQVGDVVSISAVDGDVFSQFRVVGLVPSRFVGRVNPVVTPEAFGSHNFSEVVERVLVRADSSFGADSSTPEQQEQLAQSVSAALSSLPDGEKIQVLSHDKAVTESMAEADKIFGGLLLGLLVFPAIAGVVALIVVHSTFQVIMHQRRREMGLLRAVGAQSKQLRRLVLAETGAVGALSSAVALIIGSALSAVGFAASGFADSVVQGLSFVSPVSSLALFIIGVLMTMLVGCRPAFSAARLSPMVALSPVEESPLRVQRLPRVRLAVASVVLVACLVGMYVVAGLESLGTRFAGLVGLSFVSLIAVLVLISVALPYVTRGLGMVNGSVLGQMARENTVRNPRRTSATGVAIIIGVTLMVTMMVGASSLKATLSGELDNRRPMDFEVMLDEGALPASVEQQIRRVEHVQATLAVESVMASVEHVGTVVVAGQPDLSPVMHHVKPLLASGQVSLADTDLVPSGSQVKISTDAGSEGVFTVTDQPGYLNASVVVPAADLAKLDGPRSTFLVVMIDDPLYASEVTQKLDSIDGVSFVFGSAVERQLYADIIATILTVVLGLVGVSVLVSVVGVSNTLNLAVRERTRENGLLRALGLSRRQMRRLLTFEALLISLSATAIGVALGFFYAWIGMLALPLEVAQVYMAVPWWQLGAVIIVAVASAVAASVLPGRQAARVSPVEALAAL